MKVNDIVKQLQEDGLLKSANILQNSKIKGIIDDSRNVVKDTCFIAIKGMTVDANVFIGQAIKKGAVLIISENKLPKKFD